MKPHVSTVLMLVESGIMVAIGTVLSIFTFSGPWALGGGITFCSMLPLVFIAYRYSLRWSLLTSFVYSLLQLLLGMENVSYADSTLTAVLIVLFDYILAFTVVGFSAMFKGRLGRPRLELALGIVVTLSLRFVCHFISGVIIWEVLWPNELGWAPPVWSLAYNGSFMLPEIVITAVVAVLLYSSPLKSYFKTTDPKK